MKFIKCLNALITIYKSFIRPHLNYGDIVLCDQLDHESFISKLEQVQYNAALLAITGAIECTSCSNLYKELGLE